MQQGKGQFPWHYSGSEPLVAALSQEEGEEEKKSISNKAFEPTPRTARLKANVIRFELSPAGFDEIGGYVWSSLLIARKWKGQNTGEVGCDESHHIFNRMETCRITDDGFMRAGHVSLTSWHLSATRYFAMHMLRGYFAFRGRINRNNWSGAIHRTLRVLLRNTHYALRIMDAVSRRFFEIFLTFCVKVRIIVNEFVFRM